MGSCVLDPDAAALAVPARRRPGCLTAQEERGAAAAAGAPSGRGVPVVQPGQAARGLGCWECRAAVRGRE